MDEALRGALNKRREHLAANLECVTGMTRASQRLGRDAISIVAIACSMLESVGQCCTHHLCTHGC